MTDVIDVDEAEATDISTPVLEAPRGCAGAAAPRRRRRKGARTPAERAYDEREEVDAGAEEHDELGMPGGGFNLGGLFGPGPPPVDIPADEGLDWQVEKVAKRTGTAFAVGLFAGVHLAPGGMQHTRPTFEVLDTAKRVGEYYGGLRSHGFATSAGVLLGAAFDRVWGLVGWLLVHFLTPRRFLQASSPSRGVIPCGPSGRRAASRSGTPCRRSASAMTRRSACALERFSTRPATSSRSYLWGSTSLATDWVTESYWGFAISLIIVMASAAPVWIDSPHALGDGRARIS